MSSRENDGTPGERPAGPIPPWVRIPRLEQVLGARLDELSWQVLESAVDRRLNEDLTLEFKRSPYGTKDADKHEACKDVASLANAAGGLIVIGIDQDDEGRADGIVPVDDPDSECQRLAQIFARGVTPWVRDLTVWYTPAPNGQGGAVWILVPPSDDAPHAVRRGTDALAWPVRHDSVTRWMQEPELAARYRERFRSADDARFRLEEVATGGLTALRRKESAWLAVSVAATRGGHLPADRDQYRSWLASAGEGLPFSISPQTAVLGRRRVVFTDQWPFRGTSKDHHVELHQDGCGFAALVVNQREPVADYGDSQLPPPIAINTDSVTSWTVTFLRVLATHALRCGAGGELLVRAELVPSTDEFLANDQALLATEPYQDAAGNYSGVRVVPGSMPLRRPTALSLVVPPTVATTDRELIAVSAELTHELFTEFAAVPTEPVLTPDGTVQDRGFEAALAPLLGWARAKGLSTPGPAENA